MMQIPERRRSDQHQENRPLCDIVLTKKVFNGYWCASRRELFPVGANVLLCPRLSMHYLIRRSSDDRTK